MPTYINEDIVSRHAEDAAFCWLRRRRALSDLRFGRRDMDELDDRLDGHLDGLRIAGELGWRMCREQLRRWPEPGEAFALMSLALGTMDPDRLEVALGYASVDASLRAPLVSAFGWHRWSELAALLGDWLEAEDALLRTLALAGHALHRRDPGHAYLRAALHDQDPTLARTAALATGQLGHVDLRSELSDVLARPEPALRLAAASSLVRLDASDPAAITCLETLVSTAPSTTIAEAAARSLVRCQPGEAPARIEAWTHAAPRLAIIAAQTLGDPACVPALIAWMSDPTHARIAGAAFRTLTGLDLAYHDLDRDPALDAGPSDDPADDHVAFDPDDGLPWPAPLPISRWWRSNAATFEPAKRYLDGAPINRQTLRALVLDGAPVLRNAAAQELAQRDPARPSIETSTPTHHARPLPALEHWPPAPEPTQDSRTAGHTDVR